MLNIYCNKYYLLRLYIYLYINLVVKPIISQHEKYNYIHIIGSYG